MATFRGEVAFVLNNINIRICDCLMVFFFRGEAEESAVQRHTETQKYAASSHRLMSKARLCVCLGLQRAAIHMAI
jgi:hypothetical protein